jgi:leucyl aminopeptidase
MTSIGLIKRSSLKRPEFAACFVFEGSWSKGLPWTDHRILDLARGEKFEGKKDQALLFQGSGTQPGNLLILGLGPCKDAPAGRLYDESSNATLETLRRAACKAVRAGRDHRAASLVLVGPPVTGTLKFPVLAGAMAEGAWLGLYKDRRYLSKSDEKPDPKKVELLVPASASSQEAGRALQRARIACESVNLVRDLVNTPPSELYPEAFARRAKEILKTG